MRRSRLHAVPANEVFATIHVEILVSAVLAIHATDERFAIRQIFERVNARFALIVGGVDRFVLVLEWQEIAVPSSIIDEEFAGLVGHLVEDEELRFVSFIVSVHALRLVVGKLEVVALVFRRFVALILEVVVLLVRDLIDGHLFHCEVEDFVDLIRRICQIEVSNLVDASKSFRRDLSQFVAHVLLQLCQASLEHFGAQFVGNRKILVCSVGVSTVRDLLDGVVLVHLCVSTSAGRRQCFFFVHEGEGVVLLPSHGRVSRTDVGRHVCAVPFFSEEGRRPEVFVARQFLVVDAHVGASRRTEGHGLESEIHLFAGGFLHDRNNEEFAVASVGSSLHERAVCHGVPVAFALSRVGEAEDVEPSSTATARRHHDRTIGQFFALRFVGRVGDGRCHSIAEDFPVLTEVVGIHHPVGNVGGVHIQSAHHGIDAIVAAHLGAMALHDASATEEHGFDFAAWGGAVELLVDVVGDIFASRERLTAVLRIPARYSVGSFATSLPEVGEARHAHHEHIIAFAVSHDGSITITSVTALVGVVVHLLTCALCHRVAMSVGEYRRSVPRFSLIVGASGKEVHASCAYVASAGVARVAHRHDGARFTGDCDGRDAVGDRGLQGVGEEVGLRFEFHFHAFHHDLDVGHLNGGVVSHEFKGERIGFAVALEGEVLHVGGDRSGFAVGFDADILACSGELEIKINTLDSVADGHGKGVAPALGSTAVELEDAIGDVHVVGTRVEGEGQIALVGPECTVSGAIAVGSECASGGRHLDGAAEGEDLQ